MVIDFRNYNIGGILIYRFYLLWVFFVFFLDMIQFKFEGGFEFDSIWKIRNGYNWQMVIGLKVSFYLFLM